MAVIDWLLESDPAIPWQVMRDLTDAPADAVAAERAKVATEGWGARLLAPSARTLSGQRCRIGNQRARNGPWSSATKAS